MTRLTYRYVALTDVGRRRSNNQDSGYASPRLFALADGMGGAAAGDLASSQVLSIIRDIDREIDPEDDGDALEALGSAVARANARLAQVIQDDPAVEGMGTTLEAMLWDGEKLAVAHIGDSRAYRLRDGELTQISIDHTFVQSLVDEGRITRDEARIHPHRSLLLRALLGRDDNAPELNWLQPAEGDRYLLCSDGLSDMLIDDQIANYMRSETIDIAAFELVQAALEAGGFDNVTVVITEFVAADTPMDEGLTCADGATQVVGALAEAPQPRTPNEVQATGSIPAINAPLAVPSGFDDGDDEPDEEELRYASKPPSRYRWVRWVLTPLLILGLLAAIAFGAWHWSQQQFFVAQHQGRVAIFSGVQTKIAGLTLSHVEDVTDIEVATLPDYERRRVMKGIPATNRAVAEDIVASLSVAATPTPTPTPTPSASSGTPSPVASTPGGGT